MRDFVIRSIIRSTAWRSEALFSREPFRRIAFYLDRYALLRSQYWPRERLVALERERLADILTYARRLPFWQKRLGADDLSRLPITTKADYQTQPREDYTATELIATSRAYHTSGSTGAPLEVYRDRQFEMRAAAASERLFMSAGRGQVVPVVFVMKNPIINFNTGKYHTFHLLNCASVRHRLPELQKLLSAFPEGAILFALGSVLLELARVCAEENVTLPLGGLIATGEEVKDADRGEIERIFGVPLRVSYGLTEVRQVGFECGEGRIHCNEDLVYPEVVDDEGAPVPLGREGRLIITSFENKVMPIIRYDSGDRAALFDEPCACGRTLRTIEFRGREAHVLRMPGGRAIAALDLTQILSNYTDTIARFQILRTGDAAFTLRVVPRPNASLDGLEQEIARAFIERIDTDIRLAWEVLDAIPEERSGKVPYFVNAFTP